MKDQSTHPQNNKFNQAKAFQETNEEIAKNKTLKNKQPTVQPKEIDEIEY